MEKLIFTDYKVVAMNNKSITFEINGDFYFATKRVANQVLAGERDCIYVIENNCPCKGSIKWLATPSRF